MARAAQKDKDIYIVLLSSPLLLSIWKYHGDASSFTRYFGGLGADELFGLYGYLWHFGSFFILMLLLPLLFARYRMKNRMVELGFGAGDLKYGLKLIAAAIPLLVVPLAFFASRMPEVRAEYPMLKLLHLRHDIIFWYEAAYVLLYYVAWEFYFRGFMLFSLKERFGAASAVMIQTIPSCLAHIGKPEGEMLGSIPAGILFGYITFRTGSIWYAFALHASLGVLTDLFVISG
jgi:membrane protease YdiL (CAAX protease family)